MAIFAFVKLMLVGSILYFCSGSSDASLAKITALTNSVIEQSLPAHVYRNAFGNGRQAYRQKREVTSKKLEDPQGCIEQCNGNETESVLTATMKNVARLMSVALEGMKPDSTSTPEKEAAFKKQTEKKVVAAMGPLFDDLCTVSKAADDCFAKCPESKLRTLIMMDHDNAAALCEPGKNWNNFTEYFTALNCTNNTQMAKPCESKCGKEQEIKNVTSLELTSGEDDGMIVKYETDSKKNTAAVGPVCKSISCDLDCYKPIMTQKCGAKAYDLYSRMTKSEPTKALHELKFLSAVDQANDCKPFQ